jgi:uncharacterized protein involved in exopolysaccharide biosynthesis
VFRHKGKACLIFVIVCSGALAWIVFSPLKYRSEGKLLVRLGRENAALDPTVTLGREQLLSVPQLRDNEINSIVEVLNARTLAEKVVDAVGVAAILDAQRGNPPPGASEATTLDTSLRKSARYEIAGWQARLMGSISPPECSSQEEAVRRVARSLEITPVIKSNIIRLSYQAESPELAQAVLEKVIELFLAEHIRLNRPAGGDSFLQEQTTRLYADLAGAEDALRCAKAETELVAPESRREIIVTRIGRLEDDLLRAETESAAAQRSVQDLREKLATLPKTEVTGETKGVGNHGTDLMRDRFYSLQLDEEQASAKYAEAHPKLQEVRRQIEAAKDILGGQEPTRTEVTMAPHKPHEQATLQLLQHELVAAAQRTRIEFLRAQLSDARQALATLNRDESRIDRLQREKEIAESKYRKYSAVLEEARIGKALDTQRMSNISIVQAASFDSRPVQPRGLTILAGGLAVALFGAIALAVLAEYLSVPAAAMAAEEPARATAAAFGSGGNNGNGNGSPEGALAHGAVERHRFTSAAEGLHDNRPSSA